MCQYSSPGLSINKMYDLIEEKCQSEEKFQRQMLNFGIHVYSMEKKNV